MEINSLTSFELSRSISSREISALEAAEFYLEKIGRLNPALNCFLHAAPDKVREQAKRIDGLIESGENAGPLAGVPVAIKDNILALDSPATAGSDILEGFLPPYEATAVTRLREAGAVILGKTNLDEFGMGSSCEHSAFGPTLNPWHAGRVPGGSSGGSAAAVSAGLAPAALGSDTGGSVRQPASFCGIAGMRPTYGLASRYGLIAFASSFDQIGPLARDTKDLALLMSAICGPDHLDSTSLDCSSDFLSGIEDGIEGIKIGVPTEYISKIEDADVTCALDHAVKTFKDIGASVDEISLPEPDATVASYYVIATAEASSNMARYTGVHYSSRAGSGPTAGDMIERTRNKFGPEVKRRILLGTFVLSSGYYDRYYMKAQEARARITGMFEEVFRSFDIVILPTAPSPAFKIGEKLSDPLEMYLCDIMTAGASLAGLPALSVPCGFSADGLPIGLQIIGPKLSDASVLRAGRAFEKKTGLCNQVAPAME